MFSKDSLELIRTQKIERDNYKYNPYKNNPDKFVKKVITLCGSTKFKKEFEEINAELTLKGNIVFSVGLFGKVDGDIGKDDNILLTIPQKTLVDCVHLAKIQLSDEIFVINVGGYIGESTKKEIAYAYSHGKYVNYLVH